MTSLIFNVNTLRMETAAPHLSIVVYLSQNSALLDSFKKDLESFFQKFPIAYEILIVSEPDSKNISTPPSWVRIQNEKHQGRAHSLVRGFSQARGIFLTSLNLEMTTPLGEIFKLFQNLLADEAFDLCWGNRYAKKDGPFLNRKHARHELEKVFNGILKEKEKGYVEDTLSEVFVMKKTSFGKIQTDLQKVSKTWYLGPALAKSARASSLKSQQLPVYDASLSSAGYSLWKERLRLFFISIF